MPLVELLQNLQTFNYYYGGPGNFTQKSIGYGSDDEPYIRFPLPEDASQTILDYYAANRSSLDFPVRGGGLDYSPTGLIRPRSGKYDTRRIERFLKSSPKGYTFITKQIGLQLSNPKLEVGNQFNVNPNQSADRFSGVIENTRIYNGGLNTLTQVAVQGSGIHADRHGTVPYNPYSQTYEKVVASYNQADNGINNRLVSLLSRKVYSRPRTDSTRDNLRRLGISNNPHILFQYPGGPKSVYGIGLTTIYRHLSTTELYKDNPVSPLYRDTTLISGDRSITVTRPNVISLSDIQSNLEKDRQGRQEGYMSIGAPNLNDEENNRLLRLKKYLFTSDVIVESGGYGPIVGADRSVKFTSNPEGVLFKYTRNDVLIKRAVNTDIDLQKEDQQTDPKNNNALTFNYNTLYNAATNRNKNTEIEDFRETINTKLSPKIKLPSVAYSTSGMVARLGVSNPGMIGDRSNYSASIGNSISTDKVSMADIGKNYGTNVKGENVDDLIKFIFEATEYEGASTKDVPLLFRAYLTNLQDNHSAEYSSFRYVGRGENFYTYNGFNRGVSFNFKIAAQSRPEMKFLYRKLNYLTSQIYPDYNDAGFMRAPLVKLTIGDYIARQPGFLTSLNISIADDYPWEINIDKDLDMYQLPHILDISCQFVPIHDFLPRRSNTVKNITPFITTSKLSDNKWLGYPIPEAKQTNSSAEIRAEGILDF